MQLPEAAGHALTDEPVQVSMQVASPGTKYTDPGGPSPLFAALNLLVCNLTLTLICVQRRLRTSCNEARILFTNTSHSTWRLADCRCHSK